MSNTNVDSYLWIMFSTFLRVVAAAAVAITAATVFEDLEVPRDVARDMVDEFIHKNNITSLKGKRGKSSAITDNTHTNKRQHINYDHERACACIPT